MTKLEELAAQTDRLTSIFSNLELLGFLAKHPDMEGWYVMPNGILRGYCSWANWEREDVGMEIDISNLPGSPDYEIGLSGEGYVMHQRLLLNVAGQLVQLEFTVEQEYSELDKIELTNLGYMKQEYSSTPYTSVTCSR